MNELPSPIESYLTAQASKGHAGFIATIVRFEEPLEILFRGINMGLFEGVNAEIRNTGKQTAVQFRTVDIYEAKMSTSLLAVVTEHFINSQMGFSSIQPLIESDNYFLMKPTPHVDILPSQQTSGKPDEPDHEIDKVPDDDWDDGTTWAPATPNRLRSRDIQESARNHDFLLHRLLSLVEYNPTVIDTLKIPVEDCSDDRIPKRSKEEMGMIMADF